MNILLLKTRSAKFSHLAQLRFEPYASEQSH